MDAADGPEIERKPTVVRRLDLCCFACSAPLHPTSSCFSQTRQRRRPSQVSEATLLVAVPTLLVIESCAAASLSFCRQATLLAYLRATSADLIYLLPGSHRNRRPALSRLSAIASCLLCTRQIDGRIGTSRRGRLVVAPAVSLQLASSQWWRWRWW